MSLVLQASALGEELVVLVVLRLVESIAAEHAAQLDDLLALGQDDVSGQAPNRGLALFSSASWAMISAPPWCCSIPSRNQVTRLSRLGAEPDIRIASICDGLMRIRSARESGLPPALRVTG